MTEILARRQHPLSTDSGRGGGTYQQFLDDARLSEAVAGVAGAPLLPGEAVHAVAVLVAAGGERAHGEDADVELGPAASAAAAARVTRLAGVVRCASAAAAVARPRRRLGRRAVVLPVVAAAGRVVVGVGFHAGLGWRLERVPLRIVGHDERRTRNADERCRPGLALAAARVQGTYHEKTAVDSARSDMIRWTDYDVAQNI